MKPEFTMLIGIPGSGKSTKVKQLKKLDKHLIIVCPDTIRKLLTGDITGQSQNLIVWTIALYTICINLNKGKKVVLDAANVNTTNRRNILEKLPNCYKEAFVFKANPEECVKRTQNQLAQNQKRSNVPPEIVYKMYGEFLYTLQVIKEETWNKIIEFS